MKKRDLKKLALLGLTSGLLAATQSGLQANEFATDAALLADMSPETQTLAKLITHDGSNRHDIAYRGHSCSGSGGCGSSGSSTFSSSGSHGCGGSSPYSNSQGYQNVGGSHGCNGQVIYQGNVPSGSHGCGGQGGAPVSSHGCNGQVIYQGNVQGSGHGCGGYQGSAPGSSHGCGGQVTYQGNVPSSSHGCGGGVVASQSVPTGRPYNQPDWQQNQVGAAHTQTQQTTTSAQTSQSTTRSMPQFENQPRYQNTDAPAVQPKPTTPNRPTALLDQPVKPGRYIATVAVDEKTIDAKLNTESKATFKELSPEGKKLAVKLGNQSCKGKNDCKGLNSCKGEKNSCAGQGSCRGTSPGPFKDFNQAVKVAKMKEKRQSALRGY